jgi:hypothetical protein
VNLRIILAVLAVTLLYPVVILAAVGADETPSLWSMADSVESRDSAKAVMNRQTVLFPIIFFTPETSFALGAALLHIRTPAEESTRATPGVWQGLVYYTLRNQILAKMEVEQYFRAGGIKLDAEGEASVFPDKFWGTGPDTPSEDEEDYTPVEFTLNGGLLWEVYPGLYIGPRYRFSYFDVKDRSVGGLLEQGTVTGSEGTVVSGLGVQVSCDRRDDGIYPRKGYIVDLKGLHYPEFLGSSENFSRASFDYRHFFTAFGKHVFALQYVLELSAGTVPFQMLPELGGQYMMRGFYEGRYRDLKYTAFQGEYRFPLFWNFGAVAFGSVGKVAGDVNTLLSAEHIRASGGGGIRYAIDRERHINVRVDFAFSAEGFSVYFDIFEAF